jgi:hypothetical protein
MAKGPSSLITSRLVNPVSILLLISDLEGSYQNSKKNGFVEDAAILREMCDKYYKMYFKLKKEQKSIKVSCN